MEQIESLSPRGEKCQEEALFQNAKQMKFHINSKESKMDQKIGEEESEVHSSFVWEDQQELQKSPENSSKSKSPQIQLQTFKNSDYLQSDFESPITIRESLKRFSCDLQFRQMDFLQQEKDEIQENEQPLGNRNKKQRGLSTHVGNFIQMNAMIMKIQKILENTRSRIFKKLQQNHHDMIEDVSYQYSENDKTPHISNASEVLQNTVMMPDHPVIIILEIILMIVNVLMFLEFPLYFTFQKNLGEEECIQKFDMFSAYMFVFSILKNLNTGFYDQISIITDRYEILKRNLKFYFWVDLFSLLILWNSQALNPCFRVIFFLRIFRVIDELDTLNDMLKIQQKFPSIYPLSQLVLLIFFLAHYSACGFILISLETQDQTEMTWINQMNIQKDSWFALYQNSIYFSFITMSSVGYGDIVPINLREKAYVIFMTLISSGVFGFAVSTIGSIIKQREEKNYLFKKKQHKIENYLRLRNVSKDVQNKVLRYLFYVCKEENNGNYDVEGNKVLDAVSKDLRQEVFRDFGCRILEQSQMFKDNFSSQFNRALSLQIKELVLGPHENIFFKGDQDMRLYYVIQGEIELYYQKEVSDGNNNKKEHIKTFCKLGGGNFVGVQSLFCQSQRSHSARSLDVTHIAYISHEDFVEELQKFPIDYEKFCMIRDNMMFQKGQGDQIQCDSCKEIGHTIETCNWIHFVPNRQRLIDRITHTQPCERQRWRRKKQLNFNPRMNLEMISSKAKILRAILTNWIILKEMPKTDVLQNVGSTNDFNFSQSTPQLKYDNIENVYECNNDNVQMELYGSEGINEEIQQIQVPVIDLDQLFQDSSNSMSKDTVPMVIMESEFENQGQVIENSEENNKENLDNHHSFRTNIPYKIKINIPNQKFQKGEGPIENLDPADQDNLQVIPDEFEKKQKFKKPTLQHSKTVKFLGSQKDPLFDDDDFKEYKIESPKIQKKRKPFKIDNDLNSLHLDLTQDNQEVHFDQELTDVQKQYEFYKPLFNLTKILQIYQIKQQLQLRKSFF